MNCENCGIEHDGTYGSGRFCSVKCSRSFSTKYNRKEINKKVSLKLKGSGHDDVICVCKYCGKKFLKPWPKRYIDVCSRKCVQNSHEFKQKLSVAAKKRKLGGYNPNSIKKHKKGNYKNIHCDSSWELAWVIYHIEHDIKFIQNKESFIYYHNNKQYKYYPDFILEDGTYIEIKGYHTDIVDSKLKYFPHKINILYRNDLQQIFKYVISKYGNDFIKLYTQE